VKGYFNFFFQPTYCTQVNNLLLTKKWTFNIYCSLNHIFIDSNNGFLLRSAMEDSKYCSDGCGLALARQRIYQALPDRVREWNLTPCHAEKKDRQELEKVKKKQVKNRKLEIFALNEYFIIYLTYLINLTYFFIAWLAKKAEWVKCGVWKLRKSH